jgi:hypothetical protein
MNSLTARTDPENAARSGMIWLPIQPNQPGTAQSSLTVVGESGVSNRIILSPDVPDEDYFFGEYNLLPMAVPHHGGKSGVNVLQTLNPMEQNYVVVGLAYGNALPSMANWQSGLNVINQVGGNWLLGEVLQLAPPGHVEIGTNSTAPVFGEPAKRMRAAQPVTQLPPTWLDTLLTRITGFSSLCENWDTYRSRPIAKGAIRKALNISRSLAEIVTCKRVVLSHAPFAAPTSSGGVLFEIVNANRELHIEIEGGQSALYRIFQIDTGPDGEEAESEFSVDESHLAEVLGWIVHV